MFDTNTNHLVWNQDFFTWRKYFLKFTFTILEYVKRANAFKFSGYGEQYWEYNHVTPDQPTKSKETEKSTDV